MAPVVITLVWAIHRINRLVGLRLFWTLKFKIGAYPFAAIPLTGC